MFPFFRSKIFAGLIVAYDLNIFQRQLNEWVRFVTPTKRVRFKLLYNSVHRKFNQLETWCGRESQHPAEWALRPPIEQLQLERRCSNEEHVPERLGPQAPGWVAQENGKETRLGPIEWGSICCCSVRSPNPSHTQPFQTKWEVYFSKELCCSSLLCGRYDSACICIFIITRFVCYGGKKYTLLCKWKLIHFGREWNTDKLLERHPG